MLRAVGRAYLSDTVLCLHTLPFRPSELGFSPLAILLSWSLTLLYSTSTFSEWFMSLDWNVEGIGHVYLVIIFRVVCTERNRNDADHVLCTGGERHPKPLRAIHLLSGLREVSNRSV